MQYKDAVHDTGCELLMKNDAEQRPVHFHSAVVLDESKLCESSQKNTRLRDGSSDRFRGSPLPYG
jgi:hypothetical protein